MSQPQIMEGIPTLVKKARAKSKFRRERVQSLKPPQIEGNETDPDSIVPVAVWVDVKGDEKRMPCTKEVYNRLNPAAPNVQFGTFSHKAPHRMSTVAMAPFKVTLYFDKREGQEIVVDFDMVGSIWRARSEAPEKYMEQTTYELQVLPEGSVIVETCPVGVAETDVYQLIGLLDEHERLYEGQQLTKDGSLIIDTIRGRRVTVVRSR